MKLFLNVFLLSSMLSFGVASGEDTAAAKAFSKNLSAAQAGDLVKVHEGKKDVVVLDVRTPKEFAAGHIAGAKNVDVLDETFVAQAKKLDKTKTYLVHCRSGKRSQTAFGKLKKLGFAKLYHLDGGMKAWEAAGLPVKKPDATPSKAK